jgi:hypothetical protein
MKNNVVHYGTWFTYAGTARIGLAAVLLAVAAGIALAGIRLPMYRTGRRSHAGRPSPAGRPSRTGPARSLAVGLFVTLLFAIVAFAVGLSLYVEQLRRLHLLQAPPTDPIAPVTVIAVMITFIVIFVASPHRFSTRLLSAAVGAMAGPMIFELPFDLIVMTRTYPPVPPDPALYRAYFFAPLILIEITSLSLLALSPMARLSRSALVSFALMLAVFAIWAMAGFGYPSSPLPITLNVISKILAFVTVLTLFLPQRAKSSTPAGTAVTPQAAPAYEPEPVKA